MELIDRKIVRMILPSESFAPFRWFFNSMDLICGPTGATTTTPAQLKRFLGFETYIKDDIAYMVETLRDLGMIGAEIVYGEPTEDDKRARNARFDGKGAEEFPLVYRLDYEPVAVQITLWQIYTQKKSA